jgi:hypothetical protein
VFRYKIGLDRRQFPMPVDDLSLRAIADGVHVSGGGTR